MNEKEDQKKPGIESESETVLGGVTWQRCQFHLA